MRDVSDYLTRALIWYVAIGFFAVMLGGCKTTEHRAQPGQATYVREEFSGDGEVTSRTEVTFVQNEDPEEGATLTIYGNEVSIEWGASYFRKLPKSFAHIESILTIAGILSILGAGVLIYFKHFKLAGVSGLAGLGFVGLAATVEEYAWVYALLIFIGSVIVCWMLWSAYKTPSPEQTQNAG